MLFLGSIRGALIVAITIPLSLLIAFILMHLTNIPANLLSLGAIDFGIIVDGSIVVMENILRRREEHPDQPVTLEEARTAATQVARPMFFATAIIITAYIPLFAFQRVEKKLFSPMAYTVGYALGGAMLVALALVPGLALAAYSQAAEVLAQPGAGLAHDVATTRALRSVLGRPALALVPGGRGAAHRHFSHHHRGQGVPARARRGLHLAAGPAAARHLAANGRARWPPKFAQATREFKEVSLRRHPARTERRRDRPLDALAHRVHRWASPVRHLAARGDEAGPHRQAERALCAHPRHLRRLLAADD